jgi:hypothetical protein
LKHSILQIKVLSTAEGGCKFGCVVRVNVFPPTLYIAGHTELTLTSILFDETDSMHFFGKSDPGGSRKVCCQLLNLFFGPGTSQDSSEGSKSSLKSLDLQACPLRLSYAPIQANISPQLLTEKYGNNKSGMDSRGIPECLLRRRNSGWWTLPDLLFLQNLRVPAELLSAQLGQLSDLFPVN